jgi:hypothetical protein
LPEIVDRGVAQGQQQGVDILFAKEMRFSKVIFSSQKFFEGYSFLPEIVDCGVVGLPKASGELIFNFAKEMMFAIVVFSSQKFVEGYSYSA